MTNREWLATLTDEELAGHLEMSCNSCVYELDRVCGDCVEGRIEWLKSKHEEGGAEDKS